MKSNRIQHLIPPIIPAIISLAFGLVASAATNRSNAGFPHHVPFELGEAEFAPGDGITILQVRGTSEAISRGETYCIEGTYKLGSRETADLGLFATTSTKVSVPTDPSQVVRIERGSGSFRLIMSMREEGYPHLSFYPVPEGSAFGGVYFGQGAGVLRHKGFSYLQAPAQSPERPATDPSTPSQVSLEGANRVLFEYLGAPVAPPDDLEAAYSKAGLIQAIQTAAQQAGISVRKIEIDESEFPFLVGVICPEGDYPKLTEQLKQMNDYEYHGSVGSHTRHAMNIVPYRAFPSATSQRISHRATLRMQVFHDKLSARNGQE